jgi:CRP-like cAMP-binding protein
MSQDSIRNFVDKLPYQQYLSEEIKRKIESHSKIITLNGKTELQPIGSTCKTIYFVIEGAARIFYYKNGTEVTDFFAVEGNILIRSESLFKNQPTKKGIESIIKSKFLAIDALAIFALFNEYHDLERWFNLLIQDVLMEYIQRIEHFQICSPEERYLQLIAELPQVIKIIPLKFVASYLGVTQVSLSRIRSRIVKLK